MYAVIDMLDGGRIVGSKVVFLSYYLHDLGLAVQCSPNKDMLSINARQRGHCAFCDLSGLLLLACFY